MFIKSKIGQIFGKVKFKIERKKQQKKTDKNDPDLLHLNAKFLIVRTNLTRNYRFLMDKKPV